MRRRLSTIAILAALAAVVSTAAAAVNRLCGATSLLQGGSRGDDQHGCLLSNPTPRGTTVPTPRNQSRPLRNDDSASSIRRGRIRGVRDISTRGKVGVQGIRVAARAAGLAIVVVFALASSGAAGASAHAKQASTCSYKTSRLVRHGNVSSAEARRTMGSWERATSSNRCREANCGVGGGWECFSEVRALGDEVGCFRRRASFKVVAISHRASVAGTLF
jgi:hypothetical protein